MICLQPIGSLFFTSMSLKESLTQTITQSKFWGPFLVAVASLFWATDALVRMPAVGELDPLWIVLFEHVVGVVILIPILFIRGAGDLFQLSFKDWLAAAFIGVLGSGLATVFFTASFQFAHPSVVILLQKIQPVIVVLLAQAFLKEKPSSLFYFFGFIALAAAVVLSFPELRFDFLKNPHDTHSKGIFYALAAAVLWAISTVAGKKLVTDVAPVIATFWRFVFGLLGLFLLAVFSNATTPAFAMITTPKMLFFLGYMGLIPGIIAMTVYYSGMRKTSASVTTFAELTFPVSAVALNTLILHMPLTHVQLIAGATLIGAVTLISVSTPTKG